MKCKICGGVLMFLGQLGLLRHYRQNAMMADFSWERTAAQYVALYRRAMRMGQ